MTGERRYLDLSRRLVDARGRQPFYFDLQEQRRGTPGYFATTFPQRPHEVQRFREYTQSHLPVTDQRDAVGHSVRAMYLYSAMADVAGEYDDERLREACDRLWTSTTERKMYVTGGLGADPSIEGFGDDYDLPAEHGYAETCAAIGLVLWAQRMASLTGDARYVDGLERALYNGVLSGASTDGTHYFYGNPLASNGSVHRHDWFGVACCPPNLARLLSSLEYSAYSQGPREAVVNLFVGGSARFSLDGSTLVLTQATDYPRSGAVTIDLDPGDLDRELTVSVRLPGWCASPSLSVNGSPIPLEGVRDRGYARLTRRWAPGDRVILELAMPPVRVWANVAVPEAAGRVALQRGPVVYCLEGVDHDRPVHTVALSRDAGAEPNSLSGLAALTADGVAEVNAGGDEALYRFAPPKRRRVPLRAIPYLSWGNREQSDMTVWVREDPSR